MSLLTIKLIVSK